MAVINNVAYSWSLIQLSSDVLGGSTVLQGVTAISWSKTRNVSTNYGLGGKPVNRGFGNYTYAASMTFDYNTYLAILGANTSLMDIGSFDLVISFAGATDTNVEAPSSAKTHTVTLKGCFFSDDAFDSSQDDTSISHSYDLHPFDIIIAP